MKEVVDAELYAIYNQDDPDVFFINDDSKDENYLIIVPWEGNNYRKIEIMDYLDKIQSYFKKNNIQYWKRNMVNTLK